MNEAERNAGLPETPGYRYAERVGNQLFVAGQVPHDAEGQIVGAGDPQAQARQCLENLKTLLSVHDVPASAIRRLVVYVVYVVGSHADLAAVWSVVEEGFADGVPPAALLGVARLGHPGQFVEIDPTIIDGYAERVMGSAVALALRARSPYCERRRVPSLLWPLSIPNRLASHGLKAGAPTVRQPTASVSSSA